MTNQNIGEGPDVFALAEERFGVSILQGGQRIAEGEQDFTKPFTRIHGDGRREFVAPPIAPLEVVDPVQPTPAPIPTVPVGFPEAELGPPPAPPRPSLAPSIPATEQPLIPDNQARAGLPDELQVAVDRGGSGMSQQFYDKVVEDATARLSGYLGRSFQAGTLLSQLNESNIQVLLDSQLAPDIDSARFTIAQRLQDVDARSIAQELAGVLWDEYGASVPGAQDRFIGLVALEAERIAEATGNAEARVIFNNAVNQPDGGRVLFQRMLDYIVRHPGAASPELANFYEVADLLISPTAEAEELRKVPAKTVVELERMFGERAGDIVAAASASEQNFDFTLALTDQYEKANISPVSGQLLNIELVDVLTRDVTSIWDANEQAMVENITGALNTVKEQALDRPELMVHQIEPEHISAIRASYRSLSNLPFDTILRAMLVSPQDAVSTELVRAGGGSRTPRVATYYDFSERVRLGLTSYSAAENHWLNLGLSPEQIDDMNDLLDKGLRQTVPDYVARSQERINDQRETEQRLTAFMAANPAINKIPMYILEGLPTVPSRAFLLSLGQPVDWVDEILDRLGADPENAIIDAGVWTLEGAANLAGWGIGHLDKFDRLLPDDISQSFISDPTHPIRFGGQTQLHRQDPVNARLGDLGDFASAAHSITEGMWTDLTSIALGENNRLGGAEQYITQMAPDAAPSGSLRRRLAQVYEGASEEDRRIMENVGFALMHLQRNDKGELDHVHLRTFLSLMDQGATPAQAAEAIGVANDIIGQAVYGTLNIFDLPGAGLLWKASFVNATRRGVQHIPSAALTPELTSVLNRGAQVVARNIDEVPLRDRARELAQRIDAGVVRDPKTGELLKAEDASPAIKGVVDAAEEGYLRLRRGPLSARILDDYNKEIDEIGRILEIKATNPDALVIVKRDVHRPPSPGMIAPLSSGNGLTDLWRTYKPFMKEHQPYSPLVNPVGTLERPTHILRVPLSKSVPDRLARQLHTLSHLGIGTRHTESARRSQAIGDVISVTEELRLLTGQARRPGETLQASVRRVFTELHGIAAANPDPNAMARVLREWLRDNNLRNYTTARAWRAVDMLKDIELDKIATLANDANVVGNLDEAKPILADLQRRKKAAEAVKKFDEAKDLQRQIDNLFPTDDLWGVEFSNELFGQIEELAFQRYGFGLEEGGIALLQRKVNGFMSMFFLENPGYLARNFMSNFSLSAMAGHLDAWFLRGLRRYDDGFRAAMGGFDPFAFGIGPATPGISSLTKHQETLRDVDSFRQAILGQSWKDWRELKGGGVPFIGGAPGLHFRRANNWIEQDARRRLILSGFHRARANMMTANPEFMARMRRIHPDAARIMDEHPGLVEAVLRDVSDPRRGGADSVLRAVDERTYMVPETVREFLQKNNMSMQFDDATLARIEEYVTHDVMDPSTVNRIIDNDLAEFDEVGHAVAEYFSVPPDVHDSLMFIHEHVYGRALDAGLTPNTAQNLATVSTVEASKVLVPFADRQAMLRSFLDDPELYRKFRFGGIELLDETQEEIVTFAGENHRRATLDHIFDSQDHNAWSVWNNMRDTAFSMLDTQLGAVDPDLRRLVMQIDDAMHELSMENMREQGLRARRFKNLEDSGLALSSPLWNPDDIVGSRRALDEFVTRVAAITDDATELTWSTRERGFGAMLPNVPLGEIRDAAQRAIARGHIQRRRFPQRMLRRNVNELELRTQREIDLGTVARQGEDLEVLVPAKAEVGGVRATGKPRDIGTMIDNLTTDLREVADRIARNEIESARPEIQKFIERMETQRSLLFTQLEEGAAANLAVDMPEAQFVAQTAGDVNPLAGNYFDYVMDTTDRFVSRMGDEYNDLAARLGLPPMAWGTDVEEAATAVNKYPVWRAPNEYSAYFAKYAPIRSTITMTREAQVAEAAARSQATQQLIQRLRFDAQNFVNNQVDMDLDTLVRMTSEAPPAPLPTPFDFDGVSVEGPYRYTQGAQPARLPVGEAPQILPPIERPSLGVLTPDGRFVSESWDEAKGFQTLHIDLFDRHGIVTEAEKAPIDRKKREGYDALLRFGKHSSDGDIIVAGATARFPFERQSENELRDLARNLIRRGESPDTHFRSEMVDGMAGAQLAGGVDLGPLSRWAGDNVVTGPRIIPAQVNGREFLQRPPEGYHAIITTDEIGKGLSRYAMFVVDDVTEDEIRRAAGALNRSHNAADAKRIKGQTRAEWVADNPQILSPSNAVERRNVQNTFENNPAGFKASPPWHAINETDDWWVQQLAPYVEKAQAGDPIAVLTLRTAIEQRMGGWPLADVSEFRNPAKPMRTIKDVYDNIAADFLTSPAAEQVRTFTLLPEEATAFKAFLNDLAVSKNTFDSAALRMADATADWVLHNYSNTWDIDFFLRFVAPWHLWPTRTAAKVTTRVAENPLYLVAYMRWMQAMEEINQDLPEWAQDQIPLDVLAPILSRAGIIRGENALTLDPTALFFWQDLLQPFEIGDREDQSKIGRIAQAANDSLIGISPGFTLLAASTNQFGEEGKEQVRNQLADSLTRPSDVVLGLLNAVSDGLDLPLTFPRDTFRTSREVNDIKIEFAIRAFNAWEAGGAENNEELEKITKAAQEWSSQSHSGPIDLPVFGNLFPLSPNDELAQEVEADAKQRRFWPTVTSYTLGFRNNVFWQERPEFFRWLDGMFDIFDQEFPTKADQNRAIGEMFDHPAVKLWLEINDREASAVNQNIATSALFDEFEKIDADYEAGLRLVSVDDREAIARLQAERWDRRREHALSVDEQYGTTFSKEPERNGLEYIVSPQAADAFGNKMMEHFDMTEAPTVMQELVREWYERPWTRQELEQIALELGEDAQFIEPPDVFRYRMSSWMDTRVARYVEMTAVRPHDVIEGSNAIDWQSHLDHVAFVEENWGNAQELEMVKSILNRRKNPVEAIDSIIQAIARDNMEPYFDVLAQNLEPGERDIALQRVLDGYELPNAQAVVKRLHEDLGLFWQDEHGVEEADLLKLARERLENVGSLTDIQLWLDGRLEGRADELGFSFERIDSLTEQLKAAPTKAERDAIQDDLDRAIEFAPHFQFPNKEGVVDTPEELAEYRQALTERAAVVALWEKGFKIFPPANDDFKMYYKYFVPQGSRSYQLQIIIDDLMAGSRKERDLAFEIIRSRDEILGRKTDQEIESTRPTLGNGDAPAATAETGARSAGTTPTRLDSYYNFDRVGPNTPLSRQGELTKRFLVSKYFTGQFEENAPEDYVFELLGRNGVATREEIIDFWTTGFDAIKHLPATIQNEDIADLVFALNNEEIDPQTGQRTVATFRYLRGIQGLVDAMFNITSSRKFKVNLAAAIEAPSSRGPSRAQPVQTTRTGAGGLPQWDEAVRFMDTVFHDKTLVTALVDFFTRGQRLSRNHNRMLQHMHRLFPVGIDTTFDQFIAALKLMFQTSTLITQRRQPTAVNPAGNRRFEAPRFAKFR